MHGWRGNAEHITRILWSQQHTPHHGSWLHIDRLGHLPGFNSTLLACLLPCFPPSLSPTCSASSLWDHEVAALPSAAHGLLPPPTVGCRAARRSQPCKDRQQRGGETEERALCTIIHGSVPQDISFSRARRCWWRWWIQPNLRSFQETGASGSKSTAQLIRFYPFVFIILWRSKTYNQVAVQLFWF